MTDGLGLGLTESGRACEIGPAGLDARCVLYLHHDPQKSSQSRVVWPLVSSVDCEVEVDCGGV